MWRIPPCGKNTLTGKNSGDVIPYLRLIASAKRRCSFLPVNVLHYILYSFLLKFLFNNEPLSGKIFVFREFKYNTCLIS